MSKINYDLSAIKNNLPHMFLKINSEKNKNDVTTIFNTPKKLENENFYYFNDYDIIYDILNATIVFSSEKVEDPIQILESEIEKNIERMIDYMREYFNDENNKEIYNNFIKSLSNLNL